MNGFIDFEYNSDNDIVIATPHWYIRTLEDCETWYNQLAEYCEKFPAKIDIVLVLDHFEVDMTIASIWGEFRALITAKYFRFSYRINPSLITNIFLKTSGETFNVATQEATAITSAIEAILYERKRNRIEN